MSDDLVSSGEHPMTALAKHSLGLGVEALVGTEVVSKRLFKSRDLTERNTTIRALSADTKDLGIAWLQNRLATEHNMDVLNENGTTETGVLFPRGERSFSRLRIHIS